MEPFSIATGVLGLLGTAATVIKFLDTVKSTVQNAPRTLAWALAEVNDVHSAIARLHGLFEHLDSIPKDARALVTVQDAAVTVSELVTSFDDLVDVLKPFGLSDPASMTTWDKAKWARRQDDVAKVIMRIQTRKASLTLKTRSWDTMPASVKKPYATTTMCHLLEIAAMMGIYWKEFDRSMDRYLAEGNGYILTGAHIPDLGVMFTFQVSGRNEFGENRVIPAYEVKQLCCGVVPTLFNTSIRSRFTNEESKDLKYLHLGSLNEIAKTMVLMGCNTDTANYFRSYDTTHNHLFPVPFELLGMLGKTLHIRDSAFRMLPNPTPYYWDKNSFDLRQLVREYRENVTNSDLDLPLLPQVEQLVEDTSELLDRLDQEEDKMLSTPGYFMPLLKTLHDILDRCDSFLTERDRDLVLIVVREHFQEVLKLINQEGEIANEDGRSVVRQRAEHFSELTAASPELRQKAFMELYFYKVLSQVKERAVTSYKRRQTTPTQHALDLESQVSAIWCTLVLRMVCWLLLHDFDERDVQIPKSGLLGSRLPVYIA